MSTTPSSSRSGSLSSAHSSRRRREEIDTNGLTPRSKVRALLARFDADSDDDLPSPTAYVQPSAHNSANSARDHGHRQDRAGSHRLNQEEVIVQKSRGGMAARLQAAHHSPSSPGSSEDDEPVGAYARIRKQLASKPGTSDEGVDAQKSQAHQSSQSEASEDEIAPRPRKRLHRRRVRSASPTGDVTSRNPSPGLFISPHKMTEPETRHTATKRSSTSFSDSEASLPEIADVSKRRMKQSTPTRERTSASEKTTKARKQTFSDPISEAESDDDDPEAANIRNKLTQQARPTRKASKKALEEMQRETQRMSRNMQLGYRETTKKRFSTKDLFARFNFKLPTVADPMYRFSTEKEAAKTDNEASGVDQDALADSSDVEGDGKGEADTPPTSPPSLDEMLKEDTTALRTQETSAPQEVQAHHNEDLPDLDELMSQRLQRNNKGKGRSLIDEHVTLDDTGRIVKSFRIKPPSSIHPGEQIALDSDEEDAARPKSRMSVFDKVAPRQAQQSNSLLVQRALAHVTSPGKAPSGKRGARTSATPADLQAQLRLKAHQQAIEAKKVRIQDLRARGIYVETDEEKKEREEYVADSLQKAREEVLLLAEREWEERRNGKASHDANMLSSDEDEEWVEHTGSEANGEEDSNIEDAGEIEQDGDPEEIMLSGSSDDEEHEDEEEQEEEAHTDEISALPLFDDAAGEDSNDERGDPDDTDKRFMNDDQASDTEQHIRSAATTNKLRRRHVVADEDEEDDEDEVAQAATQNDAIAAFGFNRAKTSPVSMTQMFAGTMADLDSQSQGSLPDFTKDDGDNSLAFLRELPINSLPDFRSTMLDTQTGASQAYGESQILNTQVSSTVNLGLSQFETQPQVHETPSRFSEAPDPTQDVGFSMSQAAPPVPHSTTDTVLLEESPVMVKKRGRLVRRKIAEPDEEVEVEAEDAIEARANIANKDGATLIAAPLDAIGDAFRLMQKAAKKKAHHEAFDKHKSGAKEMMDEQAEESEDEYAGMGGGSDEDGGEEDEEDRAMIDNANVKVDERKIAALHAEQDRIENEKRVNQLYNDITTGALRRRRGGDLELSDDEDDVAAERRRRKQREFARRTKALLSNEKIGKLAENTRKQAFLAAIADREEEEDAFDFLDEPEEAGTEPSNESQQTHTATAGEDLDAQVTMSEALPAENSIPSTAPQKRKTETMGHRRTNNSKRPRTGPELKQTLSELIDEPILIPDSQFSDDDYDLAIDGSENTPASEAAGQAGSATRERLVRRPVTNRLALGNRSDASINSAASGAALAFPASEGYAPIFKIPSLLRRTTTNLSATSTTSNTSHGGTTTPTGVEVGSGTKRGGSKKSNIHAQAREAERRRAVEEAERRRQDGVRKKVVGRTSGPGSVLGSMFSAGRGGFE